MKKIAYLIVLFAILININACSGYKPIFGSSNLKFEIADFSIEGNKKLGNQIYSRLRNFSKSNKNQEGITSIGLVIAVSKEKNVTSKNSAGKILEYRVNLNVKVKINNYYQGLQACQEGVKQPIVPKDIIFVSQQVGR